MVDGLKFLLTSCYTPLNEGFCILIPFIYSLFKHLQYYCYYDMYRDLGRLGLYIWAAFLASSFAYWEEHWFAYWEEHWLWVQATLPRSRGDHSGLSPRLFQPQAPNIDHLFVNCETILSSSLVENDHSLATFVWFWWLWFERVLYPHVFTHVEEAGNNILKRKNRKKSISFWLKSQKLIDFYLGNDYAK